MERSNDRTPTLVVVANVIHTGDAGVLWNCVGAHGGIFRRGKSDVFHPSKRHRKRFGVTQRSGCRNVCGFADTALAKGTIMGLNRHPDPLRWNISHNPTQDSEGGMIILVLVEVRWGGGTTT